MIVPCWITKSDVKTDLLFSHVIKAADNWNKKVWTWCWIISNPDLTGAWPHPKGDQRGRDPRFVSLIKEILLQHSMTTFVIFI